MKFADIFDKLQTGSFIARDSWEGKFLWVKPAANVKSEWCKDPILKMLADANGGTVECEMLICKYDMAVKKVFSGYSPTQEYLNASDWLVIEVGLDSDGLFIKKPLRKPKHVEGDLFAGVEDIIKKP